MSWRIDDALMGPLMSAPAARSRANALAWRSGAWSDRSGESLRSEEEGEDVRHRSAGCKPEKSAHNRLDEDGSDIGPRCPDAFARRATRRWRYFLDGFAIYRDTRRTARAIRKDVGLLGVCDIDDLVKLVSVRRGRTITVRAEPLPVSAACGSSAHSDSIVVDSGASALSQLHAKAHELGHLLYDAPRRRSERFNEAHEPMDPDLARQLFPGLKANEVSAFFKRSRYDSKQERRVEIFATVMLERHLLLHESADSVTSTFTHRRAGV